LLTAFDLGLSWGSSHAASQKHCKCCDMKKCFHCAILSNDNNGLLAFSQRRTIRISGHTGRYTSRCAGQSWPPSLHRSYQVVEGQSCERGETVGHGIWQHERAPMDQRAAGVHDVGDVSGALGLVGPQQRLGRSSKEPCRIVAIKEAGSDRIVAERADAVGDHQPALVDLQRRAAVADLDELPRPAWSDYRLAPGPMVQFRGTQEQDVLVIVPPEHGILTLNPARK